jgi:hypothetical protein
MKKNFYIFLILIIYCNYTSFYAQNSREISAKSILGNPKYQAICYGGYRTNTRDVEPTVAEIKDDMKLLSALNIKIIRTYNLHNRIK